MWTTLIWTIICLSRKKEHAIPVMTFTFHFWQKVHVQSEVWSCLNYWMQNALRISIDCFFACDFDFDYGFYLSVKLHATTKQLERMKGNCLLEIPCKGLSHPATKVRHEEAISDVGHKYDRPQVPPHQQHETREHPETHQGVRGCFRHSWNTNRMNLTGQGMKMDWSGRGNSINVIRNRLRRSKEEKWVAKIGECPEYLNGPRIGDGKGSRWS